MNQFRIEVVKTIEEAKKWWDLFSPLQVIYDTWELRYTLYKYFNHELYFYIGYLDDTPIGLMPLQWNEEKKQLEFFGEYSEWLDQNKVFIKQGFEEYIPEFYKNISLPAKLTSITGSDSFTNSFEFDNNSYFLPLTGMKNHEDYFAKYLSGQRRKMFRRVIKHTEELGIEIKRNQFEDIEKMFQFNIEHFGERSSFTWPYRQEIFRDFLHLGFPVHLLSFEIKGELVGVSFCLGYKNTFVSMNAGVKRDQNEDLNSYVTFKELDEAILVGAEILDLRGGDYNWKSSWHFEQIPQYKYIKA